MTDKIADVPVVCRGGLDRKNAFLELSALSPGSATKLINFEPGLFGGYRRINGFAPLKDTYEEVDPTNAEGPVLGVFIYNEIIHAARKQQGSNTYKLYTYSDSTGWSAINTGFDLSSVGVLRVRYEKFNFGDGDKIILADGVNFAYYTDGTDWYQIKSTNTGASDANAGGDQVLDAPSRVKVYEGHIFLGVDDSAKAVICHSSPRSIFDFTAASGGGQIVAGFDTNTFELWRDRLFVFGRENISYISVSGSSFVIKSVTNKIGCIAPDTVVEISGDLIFLSQDGFRPIAATERIGDIELATLSRKVQRLVNELSTDNDVKNISNVLVRSKSQVRFFFNNPSTPTNSTRGIIAGIRDVQDNFTWEWGELLGIQAFSTCNDFLNDKEIILHGDYSGNVYKQEEGDTFNGEVITSVYRTPFLDLGSPTQRKTFREIRVFLEPEGAGTIQVAVDFDWRDPEVISPKTKSTETNTNNTAVYGQTETVYGQSVYGGGVFPVIPVKIEGSAQSISFSFSTTENTAPYSIQSFIIGATPQARR